MPTSWNLPSVLLKPAISDSPWSTWISTDGWLSSAVVKVSDFRVGIVVFRSISFVITPPFVSIPSDSGVTSSRSTSLTSPLSTPPWIAAPIATTSSGLTPLCGSLPSNSVTCSCTAGMRVMPPTSTTWSMPEASRPASASACLVGPTVRASRALVSSVSLARVSWRSRCFGPSAVAVMNGRLICVVIVERQLDLRLLCSLVEALERHLVGAQVDALILLELGRHPVDDRLVEVVAAEVVVAVRRLHLEDAVAELEHRHVERAAAEVEDEDRLVGAFLVETVGQRGRGGLVDDPDDVEAGDLAGVLRRLALRVVEVGGHGDDDVRDRLAEERLGVRLQLLQDHRADLRRGELPAVGDNTRVAVLALNDLVGNDGHLVGDLFPLAAHEALDRGDRVLRIRHLLAPRGRPDEPLAVLGERDDGRRRAAALGVRDHGRLAALEHGHAAVGRAEVDSNGLRHVIDVLPVVT